MKENKKYKEFKDKDVSEIYIHYHQLFDDSYDGDKYTVTPMKLSRTGFSMFEDSALEDHQDAIPLDGEGSGSNDEAATVYGTSGSKAVGTTSRGKRNSSSGPRRGKKKNVSTQELSSSVEWATSVAEEIATKMNTMMASQENASADCVVELLAAGRLER